MSLCRRDTQQKLAAKAASSTAANPLLPNNQYTLMLNQLAQYRRRLKEIKSSASKEQVKRDELLPELKPYVEGVLQADTGQQDDVVVYYMIWSLDAGNVDECLRIADYATRHRLAMPEQFARDIWDWLPEEIAERTIKAYEQGNPLDNTAFTAWSLVKDHDMVDEVKAKLHKAMGLVLHKDRPDQALIQYRNAVELWDRVGVKKLINELDKQVSAEAPK
jgi:hypothetical protein